MPDFYPNRLRHWAEALAGLWNIQAPASRDPNVLIGMAEAWDADRAALQAMTEEANAEGVRATKAEALIRGHNERVEAACNARRQHHNCAEHAKLGMTCGNCPREWMIKNE